MITDKQLEDWIALLQKAQDEYYAKAHNFIPSPLITYSRGKKYTRVIQQNR